MNLDDLADTRARLMLEGMDPAVIYFWAVATLEAGADTPALRRTAAADVRDQEAQRCEFHLALDELGAPRLNEEEVGWQYARYTARSAVIGELDATRAARRIVWGAADPLGAPKQLRPFVDAVKEAGRPGADENQIEAMCMRLAREYL
ncbi:hypothetical protein OG218_00985 [Kineococcus sp. NBC_00420]|uniref:hypothetical protein n=1 Tax=Kineococcus sp. NBC_00420 TaxID=2903564 RepID=UPI002E1D313B